MQTGWNRRIVSVLVIVLALAAIPGAAEADRHDPGTCAPDANACVVEVKQNSFCGANETLNGETCVTRNAVIVRVVPADVEARAEHESASGFAAEGNGSWNTWSSEAVRADAHVAGTDAGVNASRYTSSQEADDRSTGQSRHDVDAHAGPERAHVSASVLYLDGEPHLCHVETPVASETRPCIPDPVRNLLP